MALLGSTMCMLVWVVPCLPPHPQPQALAMCSKTLPVAQRLLGMDYTLGSGLSTFLELSHLCLSTILLDGWHTIRLQFRLIPDKTEELSQGHKAHKWGNLSPKFPSYA